MVSDSRGATLNEGSRVQARFDGVDYTATVKQIEPPHPACGEHVHIILTREDGTEFETTNDAVIRLD